jgi:membrane protease YdiL (CAAX protease family)
MDPAGESRRVMLQTAVVVEGGLVALALVLGWLFGQTPLEQIAWKPSGLALGLAGCLPMVAGLLLMERLPWGPLEDLDSLMRRMILPLFAECTLVDLLVISSLAGLGEELLFRGVVQAGIEAWTAVPWLAVVVGGVLFGLAHLITPTYAVLAGGIGIYLGWLLLATGNLLVPIVAHAAYDFVALVYLLRQFRSSTATEPGSADDGWSI